MAQYTIKRWKERDGPGSGNSLWGPCEKDPRAPLVISSGDLCCRDDTTGIPGRPRPWNSSNVMPANGQWGASCHTGPALFPPGFLADKIIIMLNQEGL